MIIVGAVVIVFFSCSRIRAWPEPILITATSSSSSCLFLTIKCFTNFTVCTPLRPQTIYFGLHLPPFLTLLLCPFLFHHLHGRRRLSDSFSALFFSSAAPVLLHRSERDNSGREVGRLDDPIVGVRFPQQMGPTHPLPHRRLPLVEVRRDEGLGAGGVEESLPRLQCHRTHCRVQRRGHQGEAGEIRRALLHQRS